MIGSMSTKKKFKSFLDTLRNGYGTGTDRQRYIYHPRSAFRIYLGRHRRSEISHRKTHEWL